MNQKDINNKDHINWKSPRVLLGSSQFMDELTIRASSASERFLVQVMTFEGDCAGEKLIEVMINSPANEKVLVVDHYSDVVINDTFVHLPPGLFNKEIKLEHSQTGYLLKFAQENGIRVARTNPIGAFYSRYPLRNHKKSIVIDDTVFIGGINFSNHNFEWLDMMVCLESPQLSTIVAKDIIQNSIGESTSGIHHSEDTTIIFLNRLSSDEYLEVFGWLKSARKSVTVFSPYISEPFLSIIKSISDRISIKIVVPEQNNKGVLSEYLKRESHKGWFQYYETTGLMSHLKAILIDESELIFGSSNFDFISYLFEEEIVVKTSSTIIVEQFKELVYDPIINRSSQLQDPDYNVAKSYIPTMLWKLLRVTDPKTNQLYQ